MATYLIPMCSLLWAGMILGISFLESSVKFKAPSLDKIIGLDVGRTVFTYFHKAQVGWLILLSVFILYTQPTILKILPLVILTGILGVQIYWAFPVLNKRIDELAKGNSTLPHTYSHAVYGIGEIIKLLLLLALSIL